jgi:hypothetical protein
MGRILLVAVLCACSSSGTDAPSDGPPTIDSDLLPDDSTNLPAYDVISKFGHDVIRSVTVNKNGGETRTVYIEAARIDQVTTTGALPDGTRLLMQVNAGSSFVIEKQAGAWQYGTFSPTANPAVFTVGPNASCNGCHSGAAEPGVFTAPSLRRLVLTHQGESINCPMGPGPQPCAPSVYQ